MKIIGPLFASALALLAAGCLEKDFPTGCAQDRARCTGDALPQDTGGSSDGSADTNSASDVSADADAGVDRTTAIEQTCALLTACTQGPGATDFVSCVTARLLVESDKSGHPLKPDLWTCLDSASSCANVSSCLAGASDASACTGKGTAKVCLGQTLVTCSGNVNVGANACALSGQECNTISTSDAACTGKGSCSGTAAPVCTGNNLVVCNGSTDQGQDCTSLGGICAGGGCTGDDAACSNSDVTCSGTEATVCRFGHIAVIDCGALLETCGAQTGGDVGDPLRGCTSSATDCVDSTAPSCVGSTIHYCLHGHARTIDCTALGLEACAATATLSGSSVACAHP